MKQVSERWSHCSGLQVGRQIGGEEAENEVLRGVVVAPRVHPRRRMRAERARSRRGCTGGVTAYLSGTSSSILPSAFCRLGLLRRRWPYCLEPHPLLESPMASFQTPKISQFQNEGPPYPRPLYLADVASQSGPSGLLEPCSGGRSECADENGSETRTGCRRRVRRRGGVRWSR